MRSLLDTGRNAIGRIKYNTSGFQEEGQELVGFLHLLGINEKYLFFEKG
jgi:hypothetical protein